MELIICTVAVAPLRKEPNHRSEMVSQVLFGELAEILETKDEWLHIRLLNDNYEGWLTEHLVEAYKAPQVKNEPVYTASGLTNTININHSVIHAPMGASLTGFNESTKYLWDEKYSYKGEFKKTADPFNLEQLLQSMKLWINAPYLWGGKTYMGVDCSGFVQVVFKVQGVQLKRDAYMQAEQGTLVGNLKDTKPGDLAFFHNANG
ncbi:MAG TPA: NlpC/P60 family protein, partial [Flavisolibacter sp.]|nr:NlpC/P60 family protein [Flavisolibacter sp.]